VGGKAKLSLSLLEHEFRAFSAVATGLSFPGLGAVFGVDPNFSYPLPLPRARDGVETPNPNLVAGMKWLLSILVARCQSDLR